MKSKVKHNLYLPNEKKKVANLVDLRENFNIDDILDSYKTKALQLWLESRSEEIENEYSEIENKISELDPSYKDDELMFKLYKIFFSHKQENDENIKNTIKIILNDRLSKDIKLDIYTVTDKGFSQKIGNFINEYLKLVSILANKEKNGFKEHMEAWKSINDVWSELFKLNCSSLIYLLSKNKCYFSILGLLRFCKLRKIVSDTRDEQTVKIWKEYSTLDFYKEFYTRYGNNNYEEYGSDIKIVCIKDLDEKEKLNKSIESEGKFLILNIPSCYNVTNCKNDNIDVGDICDEGLNLVSKSTIKLPTDRNFNYQLHYIGAL